MIGLEIRFLSGRFHGNAWHHAHNEGVTEWPPSPWRILRALVAAAYDLDVVSEAMPLFDKLQSLPRYRLPAAREAHTRHYMPDTDAADHKKTKVFDTFVVVEGGAFTGSPQPVTAMWSAQLTASERVLLDRIAARVAYLGRAESWAELRVVDVHDDRADCWPDDYAAAPSTTLMALEPASDFAAWAEAQPVAKKGRDVPRSTWDVLNFEGSRFRAEGWSRVPGSRLARYVFAEPPFRRSVATALKKRTNAPTVARFAIRSAVLPRLTDALLVGEQVRNALVKRSDGKAVFSGHDESGQPIAGHVHAFVLPTSELNPGLIDHITVKADAGFDREDIRLLQRLTVYRRGGHHLELVLTGLGAPRDYGGTQSPAAPCLASSCVWESHTPFVPTRHPKTVRGARQDDFISQVKRACLQLTGCEPSEVTEIESPEWIQFRRRRISGGGHKGPDRALGFRLRFAEPVQGPIALGFGAHMGLGIFVPRED